MKTVNFTVSVSVTDERAKEIQDETNCTIREHYEILVKDNLENVLPRSGNEKIEIIMENENE